MPKVSILIPTYNREDFLPRAIESALSQTHGDVEIVIVDNCSEDGSWDLIRRYAKEDRRIRAFRNERNLGPVRNWRRCADVATGEFASLLFSDDRYLPRFLEATVPYLLDHRVGFAFTSVEIVHGERDENRIEYRDLSGGVHPRERFLLPVLCMEPVSVPYSPGCALFRIADLRKGLGAEWADPFGIGLMDHGAGPDLWLYLSALRDYPMFAHVPEPLAIFTHHGSNLCGNPTVPVGYLAAMERFCRELPAGGVGISGKQLDTAQYFRVWRQRTLHPAIRDMWRRHTLKSVSLPHLAILLARVMKKSISREHSPKRPVKT